MAKYKIRFMFEWGSGVCLWSMNEAAALLFEDYPIETDRLPISDGLKEELDRLIDKHVEAWDWDDPAGDLLWDENQIKEFTAEAEDAYKALCEELGPDYDVEFRSEL